MIRLADKLTCAKRELSRRMRQYPSFVESGKLDKEEADREIAAMQSIVADYQAAVEFRQSQPDGAILFGDSNGHGSAPFGIFVRGSIFYFSADELRALGNEIRMLLDKHREPRRAPGHML